MSDAKKPLVVLTCGEVHYDSELTEVLDLSLILDGDISRLSDEDFLGIPAKLREYGHTELAESAEAAIADNTCAEEGCFGDLNDGEGFDGYCGTHADQREEAGVYGHHDDAEVETTMRRPANRDINGAKLVAGVNVDAVDIAAGLAEAKQIGYGDPTAQMVVQYALQRHARGEESGAQSTWLHQFPRDLTSWYAILATAVTAATGATPGDR